MTLIAVDIAHYLLDLYITILSAPTAEPALLMSSPSPVSPKDAITSPAQHPSSASSSASPVTAFRLSPFWTAQTLTELKIHLRDRRPSDTPAPTGWVGPMEVAKEDLESTVDGMGQNDGTVRFLWDGQIVV